MTLMKSFRFCMDEMETPDIVSHVACHRLTNGASTRLHDHDFVELFWGIEGRGRHEINGRTSPAGERELWFIRPHDLHNVYVTGKDVYCFNNLAFRRNILDDFNARCDSAILRRWASPTDASPLHFHLSLPLCQWLNAKVRDVFRSRGSRLTLEFFLVNLIYELEKQESLPLPGNCPEWLIGVCRKIDQPENFRQGPAVMAKLSGYSPEHVARELKKYTGRTPTDIVNEARLQYAAMLLATSTENICDIAYASGFRSVSYFFCAFKRRFDISPLHYRNRNKILR